MKKTKKKFYLTKLAKPGFWHYVGDPLHPNTTMDTGIIAVYNEDIRVDEFGSYVEYKIDKTMNTQQEEWEDKYDDLFGKDHHKICSGKKCNCHSEVKQFISSLLTQARKEAREQALEEKENML